MKREIALEYAKKYCEDNGYDFNILKNLQYEQNFGAGVFFLPSKKKYVPGAGLTMDIETQPRGVLAVLPDYSIDVRPAIEELRIK